MSTASGVGVDSVADCWGGDSVDRSVEVVAAVAVVAAGVVVSPVSGDLPEHPAVATIAASKPRRVRWEISRRIGTIRKILFKSYNIIFAETT
jgi:anti-sigma-K factor RskA